MDAIRTIMADLEEALDELRGVLTYRDDEGSERIENARELAQSAARALEDIATDEAMSYGCTP